MSHAQRVTESHPAPNQSISSSSYISTESEESRHRGAATPYPATPYRPPPQETHFVEILPELTVKGQRLLWLLAWFCGTHLSAAQIPAALHRTKGHRHVLAVCDACGRESLIAKVGHACRMMPATIRSEWRPGERKPTEIREPRCPGHHWPPGDARAVPPAPDGRCRTCRRDPAAYVATHDRTGERWLSCAKCAAQAERYRVAISFRDLRAEEAA